MGSSTIRNRLGFLGAFSGLALVAQVGNAFAVPSDKEAWSSIEYGIKVYKDAVDNDIYWFIPKLRFEAIGGENKTLLRSKKLENGSTEYTVRIVPYFSKDLRELVAQNISNIRQDSQLKPVVAKSIGISLPDFGFKFTSANVTNFQYLDAPRVLKFTLPASDAETFDMLYGDDSGVNVDFTLTYDGMMTDKFYNIQVSCKNISDALSLTVGGTPSASVNVEGVANVVLGADIEAAFINSVSNSTRGIDIVSKGDITGMQEMIRRVVNLCFEPVDDYNSTYPTRRTRYPDDEEDDRTTGRNGTRTGEDRRRGDVIDPGFFRSMLTAPKSEAQLLSELEHKMDLDRPIGGPGEGEDPDPRQKNGGLLPEVEAKAKFRMKKTMINDDKQAVAKQVSLKDTTAIYVAPAFLSANAKKVETVKVESLGMQQFKAGAENAMAAPMKTGIMVKGGEQWTINAAFVFNVKAGASIWQQKQYAWDSAWPKTDGDLWFRVGSGEWKPVNGRAIIESDVVTGGELEFYVDKSSIFNKIPEKLRKPGCAGLCAPTFTLERIMPEYAIQISGRRIEVK
jgi:hypothetical protein